MIMPGETLILVAIMPAAQKVREKADTAAAKPVKKGDHVFLVDGSGYIFRAYHALPPINRKSDGLQLNAVFGFCNMLWKLLRDMKDARQADASRGGVRLVGAHVPHRHVSRLQGSPARSAG